MIRYTRMTLSWCVSLCLLLCLTVYAPGQISAGPANETEYSSNRWQYGGVFTSGFAVNHSVHGGLHYHESLDFYSGGFEGGRMVTAIHGPGRIGGRGEMIVEVLPFWYSRIPKQTVTVYTPAGNDQGQDVIGPYGWHGVTVTPLLFRWNLTRLRSRRLMPYGQLGSGLLWTSQNFPQGGRAPAGTTSRINFTPQVGFGASFFTRQRQSANFGVKVIHISSAGIGNYNPGVNVTLQFSAGYSWWR